MICYDAYGSTNMVIRLEPDLEQALTEHARRTGVTPETLAVDALRERFTATPPPLEPQDEWERRLLEAATDCGVSLPHEALSSDGLYD
jgi:predicted transcriptional regulator